MHRLPFTLALIITMSTLHAAPPIAPPAAQKTFDDPSRQAIDRAVLAAIELKMTPGAVVVAGRSSGVLYEKAYGHFTYDTKNSPAVTLDTVFDLASLSKSLGAATSVMVLADQGKLDVHDKASKYLSGLRVEDKQDITIEQLLLHRAGFIPDNPMRDFENGKESALTKIFNSKLRYTPGKDFDYSDNSFITIGVLVEQISGQGLDAFAQENLFAPLKMTSTAYNPPKEWHERCAPTEKRDGKWMAGDVHDPRAKALGGVAGHAGVFSTGGDVARYCRMLLNGGELDGVRILKKETVKEMIEPRWLTTPKGEKVGRTYGFDVYTKLSPGPRGEVFDKQKTFGHTGYTGTSYWLDPINDAFVILLTNRVHPDDEADIKMLRKRIATLAAEGLLRNANDE
jgi:CubicO group peptidase (beta-lactamase class C family)